MPAGPASSSARPQRSSLNRLLRDFLWPRMPLVALAGFFMLILAGATVAVAYMIKPAIDGIVAGTDPATMWTIGIGILIAFSVKAIANFLQHITMAAVGFGIVRDARNRLFRHVADLDLAFLHAQPSGQLAGRFTIDLNHLRVAISNGLTSIGRDATTLIGLLGHAVWLDWQLAALAFIGLPIAILPISKLSRRIRRTAWAMQEELGRLNARLAETLKSVRMVRLYGAEDSEQAKVYYLIERVRALTFQAEWIRALVSPIMEILSGCAIAAAFLYGGSRVLSGDLTAGDLTAFLASILLAYQPAKRLANLHAAIQEGLAATDRLYAVLDRPPGTTLDTDAPDLQPGQGQISLDQVSFHYHDPDQSDETAASATVSIETGRVKRLPPALNAVSLTIAAGQTVALVGPSGSGKSTLLNLIPRFYDPDIGRICIDGQDIRLVSPDSVWRQIALVGQDTALLDDSIAANIGYGFPEASPDRIRMAAQQAQADDFIQSLPEGYQTVIGDQGVRLSGGQKQRISIARAFLKDAPILLLDEPTAALDSETESRLSQTLKELQRGRTTMVIAHRLSTVQDADLICVLSNGSIVETGTHTDLLVQNGIYADMYRLQNSDIVYSP